MLTDSQAGIARSCRPVTGCLPGQERLRVQRLGSHRQEEAEVGIRPSRTSGSGYRCCAGQTASAMAPSGLVMVLHPLRRHAASWIISGDGRVLPDTGSQSGAGLCQPCAVRDGAVEKL